MKSSLQCKRTVFIDLDGVMVDWFGGVADLIGDDPNIFRDIYLNDPDPKNVVNNLIQHNNVWTKILAGGPEWWADLDPLPWAAELWATMKTMGKVCVCTSSGNSKKYPETAAASSAGKVLWMGKHLDDPNNFAICPRKALLAHPDAVLIDDFERNIRAFSKAGGYGILWANQYELLEASEIQWRVYIKNVCDLMRSHKTY
jgi:hypothetical protein